MFGDDVSRTASVVLTAQSTPEQVRNNLDEALLPLLAPLYERPDFFRLSAMLVGKKLARMRANRF